MLIGDFGAPMNVAASWGRARWARAWAWGLLLVAVFVGACRRKVPLREAEVVGPSFTFEAAVYHLAEPTPAAREEAKRILEAGHLEIAKVPPPGPPKVPTAVLLGPKVSAFPPQNEETLAHFGRGLDAAAIASLQRAVAMTTLSVSGPADRAVPSYRVAMAALLALESAAPGAIFDGETRETFSGAAFSARASAFSGDVPLMRKHVVVHVYRNGRALRAVSLGMRKLGLPDVCVPELVDTNAEGMVVLMNGAMQALAEHPKLSPDGELTLDLGALSLEPDGGTEDGGAVRRGTGKGTLRLVKAKVEDGDADNRLVALDFPGPAGTLHERHAAALATILGMDERRMASAREGDPELEAARARARVKVMALKPRFRDGPPEMESLSVKGPFATASGGVEWMWVEVTRWRGTTVEGILQNDPYDVPSLRTGSKVTVKEDEIFDYLHRLGDGGTEGNETSRILEGRR